MIKQVDVVEIMPFGESPNSDKKSLAIVESLSFVESVDTHITVVAVEDDLAFFEYITNNIKITENISESINFNEVAIPRSVSVQAADVLSINEDVGEHVTGDVMTLMETLTVNLSKPGFDSISFSETIKTNVRRGMVVNETLGIGEGAGAVNTNCHCADLPP